MKARKVIKEVKGAGWVFVRQLGTSHQVWKHPIHGTQVISIHNNGMEIDNITYAKIRKKFKL